MDGVRKEGGQSLARTTNGASQSVASYPEKKGPLTLVPTESSRLFYCCLNTALSMERTGKQDVVTEAEGQEIRGLRARVDL